jgi:hypothetical protein
MRANWFKGYEYMLKNFTRFSDIPLVVIMVVVANVNTTERVAKLYEYEDGAAYRKSAVVASTQSKECTKREQEKQDYLQKKRYIARTLGAENSYEITYVSNYDPMSGSYRTSY